MIKLVLYISVNELNELANVTRILSAYGLMMPRASYASNNSLRVVRTVVDRFICQNNLKGVDLGKHSIFKCLIRQLQLEVTRYAAGNFDNCMLLKLPN